MKELSVLITSVGSTTSIGVIKFIKKSNYQVYIVGTDINNENNIAGSSFCDKFYQVPLFSDQNYILIFKTLIKKENIEVLIPVHDHEIEILSKHKNEFEALGCRIITGNADTIKEVNNKHTFAAKLKRAGVLTPDTCRINEWLLKKDDINEKWLLKPVNGVSSRNIKIIHPSDLSGVVNLKGSNPNYIIQKFIEGVEFTVDVFVKEKKAYAIIPRIREEVRDGLCYKTAIVNNEIFIEPVGKILSLFDFYGPINIQFIQSKINSELYCIECNPRFGGSSIISLHAGVNLFDMIIEDYKYDKIDIRNSYSKIYMTRYWEEVYYEL